MVSNVTRYILTMGTFGKKEMIILSLNVSLNTILSTDYSGPAERVQLVTCRLTCDYPAKEYHHL